MGTRAPAVTAARTPHHPEPPETDVVQLQINYLDRNGGAAQSVKYYETAKRHGKDVIVMEPVEGGQLAKLPNSAMKLYIASLNM